MSSAVWPDRDRVERYINNNPGGVTDSLTRVLDQTAIDALYGRMFPPATAYQKRIALTKARELLVHADYGEDTAPIQWIDNELLALS